jgi:very-short-patch-repair endonuclease
MRLLTFLKSIREGLISVLNTLFKREHLLFRSREEENFYYFLRSFYAGRVLTNYKIDGYEIDLYLVNLKIGIEIDAHPNHFTQEKIESENKRDLHLLAEHGILTIRINKTHYQNAAARDWLREKLVKLIKKG